MTLTANMRVMRAAVMASTRDAAIDDAGVVDQSVQPAELPIDFVEHARDVGLRRDVRLHCDAVDSPCQGDSAACLVPQVVHANGVAALGGEQRGGGADAAAAAGDQHDFLLSGHAGTACRGRRW